MKYILQVALIVSAVFLIANGPAGAIDLKKPGKTDRCPVCGMFVAPYSDWIATIVMKDGQQLYFDGCKDLFRYYFGLAEGSQKMTLDDIAGIYVTDYYTTSLVPADTVYYILGSDVYGPMGKELIPVADRQQAETFMRDHSGVQLLTFEQITRDLLP